MELRDRTVMVTGCAGFIASHLAEELLRRGNRVVGVDNLSAGKREFMSGMLSDPNFRFIEGDLLTMDLSAPLQGVDVLCHLAANPDVRSGATNTRAHFDQNIAVTYRLLEAGRESGVKDIVFPSTSTVYGETDVIPTPEDYGPLLPISVYGASKLACEALIASYCHSFGQNAVLYRFANVVGRDDLIKSARHPEAAPGPVIARDPGRRAGDVEIVRSRERLRQRDDRRGRGRPAAGGGVQHRLAGLDDREGHR